jgi:hypothetical protein
MLGLFAYQVNAQSGVIPLIETNTCERKCNGSKKLAGCPNYTRVRLASRRIALEGVLDDFGSADHSARIPDRVLNFSRCNRIR